MSWDHCHTVLSFRTLNMSYFFNTITRTHVREQGVRYNDLLVHDSTVYSDLLCRQLTLLVDTDGVRKHLQQP